MTRHDGNGGVMGPKPTRHERNGLGVGAAFAVLIVWILTSQGIAVPVEVAAAIGTLTGQLIHYASTFVPRWIPQRSREKPDQD